MRGIQKITVSNRYAQFRFELIRNITIVRGNSGTGKTTLYSMVADYTRLGAASGVNISSEKKCVALIDMDWKNQLKTIRDSIVFIDEGAEYLSGEEFAKAIRKTDNYYVIFNREGLSNLPYSVEEIYEIHSSGKYHKLVKMYKTDGKRHLYYKDKKPSFQEHGIVLTEDSHSGFQFFKAFCEKNNIDCETAGSNTAIFNWLKEHRAEHIFVIADGAAFGSQIDKVMKLKELRTGSIVLCLPESFEWLLLNAGVIRTDDSKDIEKVLTTPSDYIDSSKYFSWEKFFEKYLIEKTNGTVFKYTKRKINKIYLKDNNMNQIASEVFKQKSEVVLNLNDLTK